MLKFTGKATQEERINFGFNDIRNIVKQDDNATQDRPDDVLVKFSTIEIDKNETENGGSVFPLAALAARLGYH
jgi:hypothetical protein